MTKFPLPLLGFAAYSGTGKTTLISKLIPLIKDKGYRIGVIKHTHHNIDIDKPGKDSYVLRESGAKQIVIASRNRTAIIIENPEEKQDVKLSDALKNVQLDSLDLVLVEGFKHAEITKIELHRESLGKPYIYPDDPNIIAIALDHALLNNSNIQINKCDHPEILDINNPQQVADYIVLNILKSTVSND